MGADDRHHDVAQLSHESHHDETEIYKINYILVLSCR